MHLWFSMLCALVVNIIFARILREFTDYSYWIDEDIFESFWVILVLFTLIYFSILTIRWIIKCRKFNKKWIINPKYLDSAPSKKKVWIITTIVLFLLIIVNLIYGKIQWSKIPEIDTSIFAREKHQTQLPDEEDALIQLKNNYSSWYTNDVWEALEILYFSENDLNFQIQNSWKRYQSRCIIVYSWNETSCGTWTRDKKTLNKFFNSFYTNYPYISFWNKEKDYNYFIIDWKKVRVLEYLNKNEPGIRADLQKLDKIVSLEYNLKFPSSRDDPYYLLPQFLQWYSRASMVALQYYTLKEDWDMVVFIIKLNYKMIDILNNYWWVVPHLISFVIQNVTDSNINSLIKLFPKDFRIQLSERYSNLDYDKDWMLKERTKWEYNIIWENRAKDIIFTDVWSNIPSLTQFLFHFPFLSKKDSNRFMDYAYYNLMYDEDIDFDNYLIQSNLPKYSLYNYYGTYPYQALRPRVSAYNNRLKYTLFHKQALIDNLESWKYQTWFNELEWNENPQYYEDYRIPTDEELFENKIKEYSDITNPCFWRDVLDSEYNPYYYTNFWDTCSQSLLQLTNQNGDEFWLKENLTEISQLRINYSEIGEGINECHESEDFNPNTCKKYYNEQEKNINNIKKSYIKLSDILENIKNKFPEINIENYFYIPEIK